MALIGSRAALGVEGLPALNATPTAADNFGMGEIAGSLGKVKPKLSILDRLGQTLNQPGMRAALLRSGAATMSGGLSAGIAAGAGYMDDFNKREVDADQRQLENHIAMTKVAQGQQALDNNFNLGLGDLGIRTGALEETGRHNRAGEGIDANGQRIQLHGINQSAATAQRGQNIDLVQSREGNAQSDRNSQRGFDASIYGDNMRLAAAGIGSKSKGGTIETKTKIPASGGGWFGGEAIPAREVTETRLLDAPAPPAAAAPASKLRPGMVVDGHTYLGGDPNSAASWR